MQRTSAVRSDPLAQPVAQPLAPPAVRAGGTPSGRPTRSLALNSCPITDETGNEIHPSAVIAFDEDLYFLTPNCLWVCPKAAQFAAKMQPLQSQRLEPDKTLSFQEFANFTEYVPNHSIVILDKSGDLFEFSPATKKWRVFRANLPFLAGQPDPEFIDLCQIGNQIALLDPERNNIWKTSGHGVAMSGYFKNILPWHVQKGDVYLGDAFSIAADQRDTYVLRRTGLITKYSGGSGTAWAKQAPFKQTRLPAMRPSRLVTGFDTPLYIVERENNRVCAVDKHTGTAVQFLFPAKSDLRGMVPQSNGFWIVNGNQLVHRSLARPDSLKARCQPKRMDSRLDGMVMPIERIKLPHHPGVYPGARRLYRFGIHAGLDLFNPGAGKVKVVIGTPVQAADSGKIVRADLNFRSMTATQFNRVMSECFRQHRTSEPNEDLFRGCQVWINHGDGLMTRYAHLSKINPSLKKDQFVSRGDLIGFVGVTGTGQELPGRAKFPHLHFEIWLDGKYLGWGLTQAETVGVYEDIFGNSY